MSTARILSHESLRQEVNELMTRRFPKVVDACKFFGFDVRGIRHPKSENNRVSMERLLMMVNRMGGYVSFHIEELK